MFRKIFYEHLRACQSQWFGIGPIAIDEMFTNGCNVKRHLAAFAIVLGKAQTYYLFFSTECTILSVALPCLLCTSNDNKGFGIKIPSFFL